MYIIELATGLKKPIIISEADPKDFKLLTKKRFSFSWRTIKETSRVYILRIEKKDEILGALGLVDVPGDRRIEIRLLSSSAGNIGKGKSFDRIAGCLIGFACRLAVNKYGADACISLTPKTELIEHYMTKYYMKHAGRQLYADGKEIDVLIKEYFA